MSTQTGTFFLDTFGLPVTINTGVSLASATAVNIVITKPDNSEVTRNLTTGAIVAPPSSGIVQYLPAANDTNQPGVYNFTLTVTGPGFAVNSEGEFRISHRQALAASLVVEDGSGKTNATSYASVTMCDEYHSGHLYAEPWWSAAPNEKPIALVMATRALGTNFIFEGYRTFATQALEWPRIGVINAERSRAVEDMDDLQLLAGLGGRLGEYYSLAILYPSDQIPVRLIAATCEMARLLLERNREQERPEAGISSMSIGSGALSFSFDAADRPGLFNDTVTTLLQPIGRLRAKRPATIPLVR